MLQCGADNLLVILVLVAIITGIVIDSFGARREQDDDRSDQLANSCECNAAVVYWVPLSLATAVTAAAVACRLLVQPLSPLPPSLAAACPTAAAATDRRLAHT